MDEVFAMLLKEKERLKERKKRLTTLLASKFDELKYYQSELLVVKDNISHMKKEVRRAVEKEVKDIINKKYVNRDRVYDYPCQMNSNPSK